MTSIKLVMQDKVNLRKLAEKLTEEIKEQVIQEVFEQAPEFLVLPEFAEDQDCDDYMGKVDKATDFVLQYISEKLTQAAKS